MEIDLKKWVAILADAEDFEEGEFRTVEVEGKKLEWRSFWATTDPIYLRWKPMSI